MTSMAFSKCAPSLAILLALLPQLLLTGLGRDVFLCVGPAGHVQVELVAGGCCADGAQPAGEDDSGCSSCSDIRLWQDSFLPNKISIPVFVAILVTERLPLSGLTEGSDSSPMISFARPCLPLAGRLSCVQMLC